MFWDSMPKPDMTYDQAVALVLREPETSTTALQRTMYGHGIVLGYNRCALFMARMEHDGDRRAHQ
jgi:DNA segregation ATPase FtsK/SpoIIIE-like protein